MEMPAGMPDDKIRALFEEGSYEFVPHDLMRKAIARRLTESKLTIPHYYLTIDCDGLDCTLIPALGTPEPGGLGWYDVMALATALANGPGIIGMDVSEIAPIAGFAAPQFTVARLIYRVLGRVLAGRRTKEQ